MSVPMLQGVAEFAGRYDGFLLDLWGVLHDGRSPMPGAVEALQNLKRAGKRIVILSNAPRRVAGVIRRVSEIGIPRGLYDDLLSSGEAAWRWLRQGNPGGRRFYAIMALRDQNMLEGLPFEQTAEIEAADFILNTGVENWTVRIEDFEAVLQAGARRSLPMVCANPDLVVVNGGKMEICAGSIARRYETLGGKVHYFGKPYAPIYRDSLALLGIGDHGRILAIGDSLRTDIAGANAAGIDGILVLSGIHRDELAAGDLEAVCRRERALPIAVVPAFRW